jgi:hypothetical protein|tara:strand:- start:89 stop:250 length:162 start_codon:yes stop_codon:yes gene_type:complete
MKIKEADIKKIKRKIRRDESCLLKNELILTTKIYINKKKYSRKIKHKNIEKSI